MEKYIIWYRLLLKVWIRKKSSWLQLVGSVVVVLLIAQIRIPDINNTTVGLCNQDGEFAQDILEDLRDKDSVFQFEIYEDEKEMQQAVIRGDLDSGFVLKSGMEQELKNGKKRKLILFVTTPLTTKGAVAKETLFAAFLERYSEEILLEQEVQVFGRESKKISEALLEKNQEYLDSDELFQIYFEEVSGNIKSEEKKRDTYPVRGIAAVLIFMMVLMAHGKKFEQRECVFEKALTKREAVCFEFLRYVSTATVPAFVSLILIYVTGNGVFIFKELFAMLLFVVILGIWMLLFGKLFRNGTTYASWIMTLVLGNLLLCPVFVNWAEYVPALEYLGYIFPVGIYVGMF